MKPKIPFARAAVAFALAFAASGCLALDLMGAYEKALKFDPTRLAADEALAAGREKAVQGDSLLLPQVQAVASYSHVDDRSDSTLPAALSSVIKSDGAGYVRKTELQLKQPLYNAKSGADRRQLHEQTSLAELTHRNARQDLMLRVAEAYLNVLLAQEQLRVVLAEKAAVGMQRDRAQARFDVGRGRITDVQEAQARYDAVLTREVSSQSTLLLRQAQFQELTGVPAEGLAGLRAGFVPQPPQPDSLAAWQAKGRDANARVRVRQSELAMATAEIGKYRLSGRPTVDLVASYTHKGQNGGLSPLVAADSNRTAVIGVQVTIPLYAGGGLDSRERESLARRREAERELAGALRDARLQVQDAFLSVRTGVSRVGALEQSVTSAQTALEATALGRDVGNRTELDVLDAQQRLFSSQLDLAQARNDYLIGRVRLASAAGELAESDLRALNAFLQP
jgi:outer membrane protein